MATIIEDALWTVTEEVAEHMVKTGLLERCEKDHSLCGIEKFDLPIYHISSTPPKWFGFASLNQAIISASNAVEAEKKNSKRPLTFDGVVYHVCDSPGCTRVVPYDDEPYCFTQAPDSGSHVPGYSARANLERD